MSALLSPAKPVRTRFKVPGEGAYELHADFAPPNPSRIFPTSATTSISASGTPASSNSANTAASSSSAPSSSQRGASSAPASSTANASVFMGGPLGLAKVTKMSFIQNASLVQRPRPYTGVAGHATEQGASDADTNFCLPNGITGHGGGSVQGQQPATSPSSSSAAPSSIFSFRKLTGLGSTISSKFSSTAEAPTEDAQPAVSPVALSATATPHLDHDGNIPRAPPRVAVPAANSNQTAGITREHPQTSATPPAASDPDVALSSFAIEQARGATVAKPYGVLAYNAADSLILLDMATHSDSQNGSHAEVALTLHSRSPPTAHALHSAPDPLRLLVGCANGEIIYYPDILAATAATLAADAGKKSRTVSAVASLASVAVASVMNGSSSTTTPQHFVYNKDGSMNSTRVVSVRWVPGSAFRFVSVHVDGTMIVYDTRFKPNSGSLRGGVNSTPSTVTSHENSSETASGSASQSVTGRASPRGTVERPGGDKFRERTDSLREREREKSGLSAGSGEKSVPSPAVRRNGNAAVPGNTLGQHEILVNRAMRGKRNNPTVFWQVGRAAITSCEFSPTTSGDSVLLAMTGRDGYLRILDFIKEIALVAFRSYFGALLCVSWSPDGKYLATGGEDDLVSVWCPSEERLVARLEGHTSWVSAVAWDSYLSSKGRYRIGSAGQDAKLLLWDFALDMLHHRSSQSRLSSGIVRLRSYARESNSNSTAGSTISNGGTPVGNGPSGPPAPERRTSKLARLRGHTSAAIQTDADISSSYATPTAATLVVSALGRAEVPIVEPVMAHVAHGEPLTDVWFQESGVFTADSVGTVKMWSRPPQHSVPELSLSKTPGSGQTGNSRRGAGDLD